MKTDFIDATTVREAGTRYGAELIQRGELVAFPTETVYGLGANGLDGAAVNKIFAAKGRPQDNPLILHIEKKSDVRPLWTKVPEKARLLMDTFWPGPLTLIYTHTDLVPPEVTAGLDTVAVRLPANETARALIKKAGVPIAAPSANLSGKPSPTEAEHVRHDFDGVIPLILDGGPCRYGVESTVLSLIGKPTILRPGAITKEMLEAVIGPVAIAGSILNPMREGEVAASPGMKYKHYAPSGRVKVVCGSIPFTASTICALYDEAVNANISCEILATKQTKRYYSKRDCTVLGDRAEPVSLCKKLFSALRDADGRVDLILAEGIEPVNEGLAYMNRLLRAAGFDIIQE